MSFSAPSPTPPSTNRETVVPSQRDCAKLFRILRATLQCVNGAMITKRQQLMAGERGIYWALAKIKERVFNNQQRAEVNFVRCI